MANATVKTETVTTTTITLTLTVEEAAAVAHVLGRTAGGGEVATAALAVYEALYYKTDKTVNNEGRYQTLDLSAATFEG